MFPVILDLSHLKLALIGGGNLALTKLKELDNAKAENVKVFADNFGKEFWDTAGERLTTRMPYKNEIDNFDAIIIVDTPASIAGKIADYAHTKNILVNVESQAEKCSFFCPDIIKKDNLLIAVTTQGKSPALSRRIRNFLGNILQDFVKKKKKEGAEA